MAAHSDKVLLIIAINVASLVMFASGCARSRRPPAISVQSAQPGRLKLDEARSRVMSFADSYLTLMAGASDHAMRYSGDAQERALLHSNKVASAVAVYTAACETNPMVGMADLVAIVTLRRQAVEAYLREHPLPDPNATRDLLDAFKKGEQDAWEAASSVFTPDQQRDLRKLIDDWRRQNPGQTSFMMLRMSEFSAYRRIDPGSQRAGIPGNIFGLFYLDPLSSLDPAIRQIEQTRLLAERAMFFAERLPLVMGWEARQVYLDVAASPEFTALMDRSASLTASADHVTKEVQALPELVRSERQTILENVWKNLRAERIATVDQFAAKVASERQQALQQLSEPQSPLRQTVGAASAASEHVVDRIFRDALILLIVLLVGLPLSLLCYRYFARRLG